MPTAGVPVLACADAELRALLVARAAAVRDITGAALDRGISVREVRLIRRLPPCRQPRPLPGSSIESSDT